MSSSIRNRKTTPNNEGRVVSGVSRLGFGTLTPPGVGSNFECPAQPAQSKFLSISSESLVEPFAYVIVVVLHTVAILAREAFAGFARRLTMLCPFDDHVIFILGAGQLVMNLVIANEIVPAHGGDQRRHGDGRQVAGR